MKPNYYPERRLTRAGAATAVMRLGPKGGTKVIGVYREHSAALRVLAVLNSNAPEEV